MNLNSINTWGEKNKTNTRKNKTGNTGKAAENAVILNTGSLIFENSKWLKTDETAEYLRTSPKQIRKWVYQGRLKAYRLLGKSLRFKISDLDLLIEGGRKWE